MQPTNLLPCFSIGLKNHPNQYNLQKAKTSYTLPYWRYMLRLMLYINKLPKHICRINTNLKDES